MSANYKLVRNPNPNPEESGSHYPYILVWSLAGRYIRVSSSIERSPGFFLSRRYGKGSWQLFQDMMVDFLMYGYNVELEGIGTFSVAPKSRPVMEKNEIRAESIHFKDVKFRSSKES